MSDSSISSSASVSSPETSRRMSLAFQCSLESLSQREVPIGCVIVHDVSGLVVASGHNETNASRSALDHAEVVALRTFYENCERRAFVPSAAAAAAAAAAEPEEGRLGGEEDHRGLTYSPAMLKECTLYVPVEPCVMCAAALRLSGLRACVFGCLNPRFGGCGSLASLHRPDCYEGEGDGRTGFEVRGGVGAEEAVKLLKRFYEGENGACPEGKRKRKEGGGKDRGGAGDSLENPAK